MTIIILFREIYKYYSNNDQQSFYYDNIGVLVLYADIRSGLQNSRLEPPIDPGLLRNAKPETRERQQLRNRRAATAGSR